MKVGYVIPLKSKRVSDDWSATSSLLLQTLESIFNQKDSRYEIVVVCHERPEIKEDVLNRIKLIECNFELVPKDHIGPINHYKQIDYILDKIRKVAFGLKYLNEIGVEYYMALDADDLIHQNLTGFVIETNNPNGYIVQEGYEYFAKYNRYIVRYNMDHLCGSTAVIHKSQIIIPEVITDESIKVIPWCCMSHSNIKDHFDILNKPLLAIPFPSIMYKLGHGENASNEFRLGLKTKVKTLLKILLLGRNVSKELKQAFAIKA